MTNTLLEKGVIEKSVFEKGYFENGIIDVSFEKCVVDNVIHKYIFDKGILDNGMIYTLQASLTKMFVTKSLTTIPSLTKVSLTIAS